MMKESELEYRDTQLAIARGWHKEKGTSDGSGDSIYIQDGLCFYVERKKYKRKQQGNQVDFQKFITEENGTPYYVLDTKDRTGMQQILIIEDERLALYKKLKRRNNENS